MIFSFLFQRERNLPPKPGEPHPLIRNHELHHDSIDGGEFLDDAIHMEDVQVTPTEVSIAAGSPQNLL